MHTEEYKQQESSDEEYFLQNWDDLIMCVHTLFLFY
jgi:hypothetical protein